MSRGRGFAVAAVAALMVAYCATHLHVGTDITRFLPDGSSSELAALSGRLADSPLTRTVVVSVGGEPLSRAVAAAREVSAAMRGHPEVAWVRSEVAETAVEEIYQLYFPRRLGFLSDAPETELPDRLSDTALRERARLVLDRLATPASSFFEPLVSSDPLGAFEQIVRGFSSGQPELKLVDDQLTTPDGRHAIVLLGTRSSAFDSGAQGPFLADLRGEFERASERQGGGLVFELSAVGAFAVDAEQSIKSDVYLIALCSSLGVAAVFIAFVASLRGLLIVLVAPFTGVLVATTLGLLVFGELDGLTMAFGASLMGIAIDYSNHLLLHHGLSQPPSSPERVALRLRPSLTLGALTTVASFVGLGVTPFPAFRQMAFFSVTGVLAGLAASLWLLPALLSKAPPLPERSARVADSLGRAFARTAALPRFLLCSPLWLAFVAVLAIPTIQWSDDLSKLSHFDPELVSEDRRVRERIARLDGSRFVIAVAPDVEGALAKNDEVYARLEAVVEAGGLEGMRSLHSLLWAPELQRRNFDVLAGMPDLYERIDASFAAEGFRAGAFASFGTALSDPRPTPLALSDLQASPLAEMLAPFVFELEDRVGIATYLRGIEDPEAVAMALAGLEGVHLLDQRTFVDDIYREFRETSLRQILLGGFLVLALLAIRYRAWRPVIAAFAPSALVAVFVLAMLAVLGIPANLLHVMSLVMVTGMGVDYGIFCVDSIGRREAFGTTLLSMLLSCLTTAFVFGTLAFSEQPSLRAIGMTTGVGVLLSYALAPIAVAVLRVKPAAGGGDA